jgi:hypothetical protein
MQYKIKSKDIILRVELWLKNNINDQLKDIKLGLAEWDDRQNSWRISLLSKSDTKIFLGELFFDINGEINKNTPKELVLKRLNNKNSLNFGIGFFRFCYFLRLLTL